MPSDPALPLDILPLEALPVLIGLLGLIVGSFLSALTYRLPRGEDFVNARSRCPGCGRTLTARDLIPLFSWLMSRGRCRQCGQQVSVRYPLLEAGTALIFLLAWQMAAPLSLWAAGVLMAIGATLIALSVIDHEHGRLPNSLLIVLAALLLAWSWLTPWRADTSAGWLADLALGGGLTLAAAIAIGFGARLVGGDTALGIGDIKLITLAGMVLNGEQMACLLALTGLLALLYAFSTGRFSPKAAVALGPPLSVALFVMLPIAHPVNRLVALIT